MYLFNQAFYMVKTEEIKCVNDPQKRLLLQIIKVNT